ncbi:MAG TPA: phosphatase PAP2 family protein [Hymenobacter sp.]|uniref:phosphatase PAP2 family protein n=1 Tax=Hymenobacter sp. TaxID=1898978 RepID=UPI002EDB82B8
MPNAPYWMRLRQFVHTHKALVLLGFVVPWAVFGALAWVVTKVGHFVVDEPGLLFFHRHATPWLDRFAVFLTIIGHTGPMIGVGVVTTAVLWWQKRRLLAWAFAVSVGGSMLLTQVLKPLLGRARPDLWTSIRPEKTLSFPSGHAMDTAAIAAALAFVLWHYRARWPAWVLAPLFAVGVGWARMYLGVHYPSDVLAGWCSAVGWVVGIQVLFAPVLEAENGPFRA